MDLINLSTLDNKQRLQIAESALFNGVEKASTFYKVKRSMISKWINNIEKLKEKVENERVKSMEYSRTQYQNLSEENKAKKKKYQREALRKFLKRHCFYRLLKNLKKNLRQKGYEYPKNLTVFSIWCLAKKQKLKCAISGIKLTGENLSLDHIVPLSRGGDSEITNLQLVEKRVNVMKSDMNIDELVQICEAIVKQKIKNPPTLQHGADKC
jgi:5-methylcytosine-specific restriction endonuclease McrA